MYKWHNEVERLFCHFKGYCGIFLRFELFDVMFLSFVSFVLTGNGLR